MNDMESVYDANSLLDAFNKSKKGTAWKESVQRYEMNLLRNINQTQKEMKDGTYEQKDFYEFKLHERGKTRHIKSMHISDRVVQRSVCDNVLVPELSKYLTYDNGASMEGKGIHFARKRLSTHLHKFYRKHKSNEGYVLLIDFSKFFDNIVHDGLIKEMRKKIGDKETMSFIEKLMDAGEMSFDDVRCAYASWKGGVSHYDSYNVVKSMDKLFDELFIHPFIGGGHRDEQNNNEQK